MASRKADDSPVFQLRVTLKGSKPPIWRRIQVRGSTTLYKFHGILQTVMGWTDSHLHQFTVRGVHYGIPDPDWGMEVKSERRAKLAQIIAGVNDGALRPLRDRFAYEYDFGDSWEHEILVEKVLSPEPGVHYPVCLAGKRACPPEDIGGVWGYAGFIEAIRDPKHPEHDEMLEWVGGSFDPEVFDQEDVNQALKYV